MGGGQARLFDIAVVGGGVNGCGIARDAAGRGLSVLLLEQNDLASATSSSSSKLIHGGIRYLEHFDFGLVRESLKERDVILNIAPHISRPLRFVFPHNPKMRPMWMIRIGLFLYDHLGGRSFPSSRAIPDFRHDEAGRLLEPPFTRGFEYSDCWIDDARLVILNARDAALRGATVEPRTRCVRAATADGIWSLDTRDTGTGRTRTFRARELINATGPWASAFLSGPLQAELVEPDRVGTRNVKGSHLIVKKWYDHDRAYILQNRDERIVFVLPFEDEYLLIGTTDVDYDGDPGQAAITGRERSYLLDCVNEYFERKLDETDVVGSFAGVRPLYDDGAGKAQEASRSHVLKYSKTRDGAGLLNVFGGKLTTYRKLAEAALGEMAPDSGMPPAWTAEAPLPGGEFEPGRRADLIRDYARRFSFVPQDVVTRWFRSYGLELDRMLDGVQSMDDLGHHFGAGLYEIEVSWMVNNEWALTSEDVLWRRSKLGLNKAIDVQALDLWLKQHAEREDGGRAATG